MAGKAQYRNRARMFLDILSALGPPSSGGIITAASLMRGCNISYRGLDRLLTELVIAGMVLDVRGKIRREYVLTEKGSEFLRRCREFERMSETFGVRL